MDDHERRVAENEELARRINEEIEREVEADGSEPLNFLCECALESCAEAVRLNLSEYGRVREHPRRFIVIAGHEDPTCERVVEQSQRYLVVEKIGGAGRDAEADAERA
jgi:hypothetical protein